MPKMRSRVFSRAFKLAAVRRMMAGGVVTLRYSDLAHVPLVPRARGATRFGAATRFSVLNVRDFTSLVHSGG